LISCKKRVRTVFDVSLIKRFLTGKTHVSSNLRKSFLEALICFKSTAFLLRLIGVMIRGCSLDAAERNFDSSFDTEAPKEVLLAKSTDQRQRPRLTARKLNKPRLRQGFSTTALLAGKLGYSRSEYD